MLSVVIDQAGFGHGGLPVVFITFFLLMRSVPVPL
jgi:hypothetical protein